MAPPDHPAILGYSTPHPFSTITLNTKESVQDLLTSLLNPLLPHFSPLSSRIKVPGSTAVRFDVTASEIEGYARPLWGLASLLAGGGSYEGIEKWIEGLKAGTDPEGVEFWGLSIDSDQRMVEMCCIGYTLAVVPEFWERLSEKERDNAGNYLGGINDKSSNAQHKLALVPRLRQPRPPQKQKSQSLPRKNNHRYQASRILLPQRRLVKRRPPNIHQMDYYSGSFAIQVLQLLYSVIAAKEDPENAKEFKERAKLFAGDFFHYFDEEGKAIPFGRSVGYRFAMVAFWSAAAYADVELPEGITWGVVKGIALRNLRWWQGERDIFGAVGTLTLGYTYPNMYMCENYNSPGSPYWACIAFICLAVPESHPFWSSPEEPYPTPLLPPVKSLPQPGHITSYLGGHRMLLSSGQACGYPMKATHAKYGKFAYSSTYAYSVPPGGFTLEQYALDSTLGLSDDGGEVWKTRRLCEKASIEERDRNPVLVSTWKLFIDVQIETFLIPPKDGSENWYIRAHRIRAGREMLTAEGGWAICNVRMRDGRALGAHDEKVLEGTFPKIMGNYDLSSEGTRAKRTEGAYVVSKGAVGIVDLLEGGEEKDEYAMIVNADLNSNLVESKTVIPTLMGRIEKGEVKWVVVGVYARPGGGERREKWLEGWERRPNVPEWLRGLVGGEKAS